MRLLGKLGVMQIAKKYKDPLVLIQEYLTYIFKPKNHIAKSYWTFMINVYHTFGHHDSIRLDLLLQTT